MSRIEDLDEFQGLTADMVRHWLRAQAPRVRSETVYGVTGLTEVWTWAASGEQVRDRLMEECLAERVRSIASIEARSLQALLREINPRMRKGMPSRAALEAHGENGDWVVFRNVLHAVRFVWTVCDAMQMVSGFDVFRSDNPEDAAMIAECSFWPCDEHGNKVRWPEKDGVML